MGPQKEQQFPEAPTLIRRGEVEKQIGFARSSLERLLASQSFPAPVRIGRSRRWLLSAVSAWISEHSEQSRQAQQETHIPATAKPTRDPVNTDGTSRGRRRKRVPTISSQVSAAVAR